MRKKRNIIIALTSTLLLIAIILGLICNKPHRKDTAFEDSNAVSYSGKIKKPADFSQGKILLPGFDKIKVDYGNTKADVVLSNPSCNHVYFKFIVVLKMKNQENKLIETKLVPPGKAILGFKIPKNLPKGKYPLKIEIKTYDLSNRKPLNGGINDAILEIE